MNAAADPGAASLDAAGSNAAPVPDAAPPPDAALPPSPDAAPTADAAARVSELIADRLTALSPAERRVARALLADYPSAGLRTVAALADDAGVSAPSVVRFSVALGFDSFRELQASLRNELRLHNHGPLAKMPWNAEPGSESELLAGRAHTLVTRALASLEAIPPTELEAAIELLSTPGRPLVIFGGRFSGVLAQHLTTSLEQVRERVRLMLDPFGGDLGQLVDVTQKTVCLIFDFHRYQASAVRLAELAKLRGATVLLVTDERLSPAAASADVVLPISVDAPSPFYSLVGALMLTELLVVPVVQRLGERSELRISRWDAIRSEELVAEDDGPTV
ncbi:MAG: MurR/RpiR family transcriptional regulator [Microbacteriaceae bacterium]|nr:MAG: MurR/RpiR family transcriptional regulator [Microbacteriaceae bacterium]